MGDGLLFTIGSADFDLTASPHSHRLPRECFVATRRGED
jgi:hypothetical protein